MKAIVIPLFVACSHAVAVAQITQRVTVASDGTQSDSYSEARAFTPDGRFVVLFSSATTLVPGDTNNASDVFVHDRSSRETTRVSVSTSGSQVSGLSYGGDITPDGRFVLFSSGAPDVVPGDTNGVIDVFVRDRTAQQTMRVSLSSAGVQSDGISNFNAISDDGRFVVFDSVASNLVAGDTNNTDDVFVHDRQSGLTTRVSVSTAGVQGNKYSRYGDVSGDGRYVAFWSYSTNLVMPDLNLWDGDVFLHDRSTGVTSVVSVDSAGAQHVGACTPHGLSSDGRFVLFASDGAGFVPGDTNDRDDLFLLDRSTGQTTRVSVGSGGTQIDSGIVGYGSMSSDARYIAFDSYSSTITPGDTNGKADSFLYDRLLGITVRVSLDSAGGEANDHSYPTCVADDGSVVVTTYADNLVLGDTNGTKDVFVHTLDCPDAVAYCAAKLNSLGCLPSIELVGSASGSAGSGATLRTMQVLTNKNGVFFHGTSGPATTPFHGGVLCVQGTVKRHPVVHSGGSSGCSGVLQEDLNAYIASGADPALVAGATLYVQTWSRDPGDAFGDSLSNALRIDVCQ